MPETTDPEKNSKIQKLQKQAQTAGIKPLEAIALYEQILQLEPNSPTAHSELGNLFTAQGWEELALPHYARALALAPKSYSLESYLHFGNLLQNRGRTEEAIAAYKQAIQLNSNYIPAYQAWVKILINSHRLEEALNIYSELANADLVTAKDYSDLGIACINSIQSSEQTSKSLNVAIACFEAAITLQPDYAPAHCNLGNALLQQENIKEAVISFREALSIDPNFAEVYYNLGIALTKIAKLDEAIACFEAAVALNPEFANLPEFKKIQANLQVPLSSFPQIS